MKIRISIISAALCVIFGVANAYIPGLTPTGATRHWSSGNIRIHFTGPSNVDGHDVKTSLQNALTTWDNTDTSVNFTMDTAVGTSEPSIGNNINEFGWSNSSDNPYLLPDVPCTTAYTYDTASGIMIEADTTCNALNFTWQDYLFGNYTQDDQADAETMALTALGYSLGLDASLAYGQNMYPSYGAGYVWANLTIESTQFAEAFYYGNASRGSISGTVRIPSSAAIPYAYVEARGTAGVFGAVADANGAYTIPKVPAGSYWVYARPLTTDPTILSSLLYRENPVASMNFTPAYASSSVTVTAGGAVTGVNISTARPGTAPDGFEPNDTPATGTALSLAGSYLASVHVAGDQDWFYFTSTPNTCYTVQTALLGASTVPTDTPDHFWSATQLALYSGATLVGQNVSIDDRYGNPASWVTYCEGSSGQRLDLKVEQRNGQGGAGYFYEIWVYQVTNGTTVTPVIGTLYPNSGWVSRNRYVWISGSGFMPSARVDVQLPNGTWASSTDVIVTGCDANYSCTVIKALFPPSTTPGFAHVKVTNPNTHNTTKASAFEYLAYPYGPIDDRGPFAFDTPMGYPRGFGLSACIGDYNNDGLDDILKLRWFGYPSQLFRNNGDSTFSEVAVSSGFHFYTDAGGMSCSFVDVDDDGDLDVYATMFGSVTDDFGTVNELYKNQISQTGTANFVLNTPALLQGDPLRRRNDAAWADFDKDGRLDVAIGYETYMVQPYYQAVRILHQNADGSFANRTPTVFDSYFANVTLVRTADFNNDECDDLVFFTRDGIANRLYLGDCHGGFSDFTAQSHIADRVGNIYPYCYGVGIADFNNDGNVDVFCGTQSTSMNPSDPTTYDHAHLWINDGSARFTDYASASSFYSLQRNMHVVLTGDFDNDGNVDLYLGNSDSGYVDDSKDVLLHNNGTSPPTFTDITDTANMYPFDNDGTHICTAGVDEFYCDRDASAGGIGDWTNDGAQDVFVTGTDQYGLTRRADFLWFNHRQLLRDNNNALSNDWIEVTLKGGNTPQSRVLSNRFGIGAKVTVIPRFNLPGNAIPTEAQCLQNPLPGGVVSYTREVLEGNQSQSSSVLHYGLGNILPFGQKRVDCIRVKWPSGLESAYVGLTANNKVTLAEDAGRIKVLSIYPNSSPNTQSTATSVRGLHFERDVSAVPQVFFGTTPGASVTFVSEHELTAFSPTGQAAGTVNVTVTNPDDESDTLLAAFTFTAAAPSLMKFKDPVPDLLTPTGTIITLPNTVVAGGTVRIGVIADGVTQIVVEQEVPGPGTVRFAVDDDTNLGDGQPSALSIGSLTSLGGSSPATTKTVTVVQISGGPYNGRYFAHAVYRVPQDFDLTSAFDTLAFRPIMVTATYVNTTSQETALPYNALTLWRVPVLYVGGMWPETNPFGYAVVTDPRWISLLGDYKETNAATFAENAGTVKRLIKELRDKIHSMGIAGTRFTVVAHSMGGVLTKLYIGNTGAPYTDRDNFFLGDAYTVVAVDSPFGGSDLAPFMRSVGSLPVYGPEITNYLRKHNMPIDEGCMWSLDPAGPDIRNIPAATGLFHVIQGWGGKEMRAAGVQFLENENLKKLEIVLKLANRTFDNYLINCGNAGDDVIVCTDSQAGGLSSPYVSPFHYQDLQDRAIHFGSICIERDPGNLVRTALLTPTTDSSFWAGTLPATATFSSLSASSVAGQATRGTAPVKETAGASQPPHRDTSGGDGYNLNLQEQGDGTQMNFSSNATRRLKGIGSAFAASVCIAVSGGTYADSHELGSPTGLHYVVVCDTLCAPARGLSIAGANPPSGSYAGGYTVTLLGSGFDSTTKVKVGAWYAANVSIVNPNSLTFSMMSGLPGATTITVITGTQTATAAFTYLDPGPVAGGVQILTPTEGTTVEAGSAVAFAATGVGGFTIASGVVDSGTATATTDTDQGPGFSTTLTIPNTTIGSIALTLYAKDAASNLKVATVNINVVVPAEVALNHLQASEARLLYGTPTKALHIDGVYTDGVTRNVTGASGITYLIDAPDSSKPGYPYNGTNVATVDGNGVVTAVAVGNTICHVTYLSKQVDVVITVVEIRPMLAIQNPGFFRIPYQGAGVTYSLVRGTLSMLRSTGGDFYSAVTAQSWVKCNQTILPIADSTNPPVGGGLFYLMKTSWEKSYDEPLFWSTRSQIGERTAEIMSAPVACSP